MAPETFISHVRNYCAWAESDTHDIDTAYQLMQSLREGAPGFKTSSEPGPERGLPGIPVEVQWAETKRYVDFPFCAYPVVFWPYETHPEGPFTEIIYDDFAHIYAELRHGLQILESGNNASALRYWRDSYIFHWGHHASAAIWAIEWYREGLKKGKPAEASDNPAVPPRN